MFWNKLKITWETKVVVLLGAITTYLILLPLGILLWSSFRTGRPGFPGGNYTLTNYITAYRDTSIYSTIINSFFYASGDATITLGIAIIFAWLLERTNMPLRSLSYGLVLVPMAIPGMLFSIAWVMLLTPSIGFINMISRGILDFLEIHLQEGPFNIYSWPGMIFLAGLRGVPTLLLMIIGSFRMMDPALEEVAIIAGANRLTTLRKIVIPVLRPAIFVAFIYSFIGGLETFEIPAVVGIPAGIFVFSTKIYFIVNAQLTPNFGLANAFAVIFIVISLILLYWYTRVTKEAERFATVTGKGYRPRVIDLGRWRYPAVLVIFLYFTLVVILPIFILFWNSLMPYYQTPSFKGLSQLTLENYSFIFTTPKVGLALRNTLFLVLLAPPVTMLFSFMIGWVAVRTRVRGRRFLDAVSFLPHTMPSVVIGLALILVYLNFRFIPIYGTIWIVLIGFVTKYVAFGARTANAAIMQIHQELEEAAEVCGVPPLKKITYITLPLIFPAFISGCVWVAVHAMRELSIALMLFSKKNVVLSTLIWDYWQEGEAGPTAAMAVLLILALIIITSTGRILVSKMSPQQ